MARVRPNGGVLGPPITVSGTSASGMFSIVEANLDKQAGNFPVYTPVTPVGSTDPQFNLTTLLLHGDGSNAANNNTFLDSSTNAFTLTSTGTPIQGSFSPFSQTGWSNYFNGSQYITTPANAVFQLTGNFTVEAWIYPTVVNNYNMVFGSDNGATSDYFTIRSTTLELAIGGNAYPAWTQNFVVNTWYHVAVTRSSNTLQAFVNGTQLTLSSGSATNSSQFFQSSAGVSIGRYGYTSAPWYFTGYISNARIVKGTAVYTSAFTPSVAPLTAISGTQLLTCQSNRFKDNSTNAFAITVSGSPQVQAFSPFVPLTVYSTSAVGGSMYFNGSTDYLAVADNTNLRLSSATPWTIEAFIYLTSITGDNQPIISKRQSTDEWQFNINGEYGYLNFWNADATYESNVTLNTNTWYHVAVSWDVTTLRFFINGTMSGETFTGVTFPSSSNQVLIGCIQADAAFFPGYISNLRFVNGTAVYTSAFTPPTAPLTAITNTQLLLNGTNAAIYDSTAKNDLVTVGSAQISTAQAKFGGSSMNFGSGSYLTSPTSSLYAFGTGDFTIETFIYLTSVPSDTCIIDGRDGTGTVVKPCLFVQQSSSNFIFYVNGAVRVQGGTYSLNTWQHVAVSRSGGSTKLFVNGTQVGSTYTDSNSYLACSMRIAYFNDGATTNSFNGYIDELRITKYARYTSTFTPTTSSFPNQ